MNWFALSWEDTSFLLTAQVFLLTALLLRGGAVRKRLNRIYFWTGGMVSEKASPIFHRKAKANLNRKENRQKISTVSKKDASSKTKGLVHRSPRTNS